MVFSVPARNRWAELTGSRREHGIPTMRRPREGPHLRQRRPRRVTEPNHHPDAARALSDYSKETRGRILTALARNGFEVAEAGSNLRVWKTEHWAVEVAVAAHNAVNHPGPDTLAVLRYHLNLPWVRKAVERWEASKGATWVEQARQTKGNAA